MGERPHLLPPCALLVRRACDTASLKADYDEEQRMELEILESIFPEDLHSASACTAVPCACCARCGFIVVVVWLLRCSGE
jgi:hypothetical protein